MPCNALVKLRPSNNPAVPIETERTNVAERDRGRGVWVDVLLTVSLH
jgi:hypothetical protein